MAEKFKEISEDSFHCQDVNFTCSFFDLRKNLQSKLLLCRGEDPEVLSSYFDQIISDYQKLQKLLSDNTMFMPAYDIKTAQSSLKSLQEEIQQVQDSLIPKKKFSFKHKGKFGGNIAPRGKSKIVVNAHCKPVCINTMENMADTVIRCKREEINGKNISLCSMQNCKVYLPGTPGTLVISDLVSCQVFTGPVISSVYIDNCQNCTFVIACQQLRVHTSTSCIFYLHISSRTIIEDCFKLQFAPYNWTYDGCCEDFISIGLDVLKNKWDAVDDFNWLVAGCPSPNWSYMPKENYSMWE